MTRLEHCLELVGDIRECAGRAKDLGKTDTYQRLSLVASDLEATLRQSERTTLPPVLAANQEARATASKHFKAARELLKGIR